MSGKRFGKLSRTPAPISRLRQKKLIAFGYYGGKFSHLEWLLSLLPSCHHYCEPFAGSGAVLLNRPPSPIETYNDLDGEVVNFFRVCRDNVDELQKQIALTPVSREEFAIACELDPDLSSMERARRYYVRIRQVRSSLPGGTLGQWCQNTKTSRKGMSLVVSRFFSVIPQMASISLRLLRCQIENRPAIDIIRLYDTKDTLFYCDPPYLPDTRSAPSAYNHEMSENDHIRLAAALSRVVGRVAFSNYDHPIFDTLYPSSKWTKLVQKEKTAFSTRNADVRQEVLWINYKL